MRWLLASAACLLVLGGAWPSTASADSIRCDGRLVSVGDTSVTLRARCGAPDHLARYPVLRTTVATPSASSLGSRVRAVEEEVQLWTYVGDPGDLWRLVRVRRGVVESVTVLGRPASSNDDCTDTTPSDGTTVGEVRLTCGAPVDRSRWIEERSAGHAAGATRRLIVRERWIYDPGPGRLLRVLEFANGKLVSVSTAERSPS